MPSCRAKCQDFENDGVCDVPEACPSGTDCADCGGELPLYSLLAMVFAFVTLLLMLGLACHRHGERVRLRREEDRLLMQGAPRLSA